MTELDPIDVALANWQKWCLDWSDRGQPASYPAEWPMGKVWLPYKVMITEDEALEEIERTHEPDENAAMQVERWVNALPELEKVAVRTHYIHWPDSMRNAWHLTSEDLAVRRARRLARITGSGLDVDEYHRLVGSAIAYLREAMNTFRAAA